MAGGFTKLHSSIIHSSIWSEPHHVRIVWVTMLAMADADGVVEASVSGLAHAARVTRDECRDALECLAGPDPDSRDGTTGERIEDVPGGWRILNYGRHRERKTREQKQIAERVRRHRERNAEQRSVTLRNAEQRSVTPKTLEAEAEAEAEVPEQAPASPAPRARAVARPGSVSAELWADFRALRKTKKAPLTPTAWSRLTAEVERAGWSLPDALQECVARGWASFKAEWVQNRETARANKGKSHAPQQTRHRSELSIGDPACDCLSCRAYRRDRGRESA